MSDQDFFFEDEEVPTPEEEKAEVKHHAGSHEHAPRKAQPSAMAQTVTMSVALLMAVVALLFGVIIGLFLNSLVGASNNAADSSAGSATVAPALTQQQIQNGQLPAGHPSVGSSSTTTSGTGQ